MRLFEKLVAKLGEYGVYCDVTEIYATDTLPGKRIVADQTVTLDFTKYDMKITAEKDAQIEELDRMRISWIETAQAWSVENEKLRKKIEDLEAIIRDGRKSDVSVSENGISIDCECGGYHLAKQKIAELEDRHQSDCIRINQLLTTIDVLTERYQKLREVHGIG